MKKVTYIVLLQTGIFDRKNAEEIEDSSYEVNGGSGCQFGARVPIAELIAKELEVESVEGIHPMSLSDYMDDLNDQEYIEYDGFWVSYIKVTINTK